MSTVNGTRITFKRTRPNPLFQDWLEELHEEAQQKGSKLAPMLKEALSSISKYPLPLQSGAECAILKGFDKRLCLFLDKRLEVYTSITSVLDEENVVKLNSVPQLIDSKKISGKNFLDHSVVEISDKPPMVLVSKYKDKESLNLVPQKCLDRRSLETPPKASISLISDDENEKSPNFVPQLRDSNNSLKKKCLGRSLETPPKTSISLISDDENQESQHLVLQVDDSNNSTNKNQSPETLPKSQIYIISDEQTPNLNTQSNSLPTPEYESMRSSGSSEISKSLPTSSNSGSSPKNKRGYTPALRSAGYAFLLALVDLKKDQTMSKDQLVTAAQNYCDINITKELKSLLGLIKKGFVKKIGERNRSLFCLTEAGVSLAMELENQGKKTGVKNIIDKNNHVKYKSESEVNDLLFNNNTTVVIDTEAKAVTNGSLNNVKNHLLDDKNDVIVVNTEATSTLCNTAKTSINNQNSCIGSNATESKDNVDYSNLIVMEPGSFDIVLLIDCHETSGLTKKNDPTVTQFKKYPKLKHEYRSLKVGDFTWIARSKINKDEELVLPFVVERKRMDDLGHSIKDGRFHEQKFRLRKCGLNNVIYLVENYRSNKHVGLPMQSLMQALANTRIHDGFKVHVTDSLVHTVNFLVTMTLRLKYEYKDKGLKGRNKEPQADILMTFEYFNKASVKNRALSVTDTFIKLLLQLKGVSVEKALTITSVYKTPRLLIEKYKTCDQKDGEMLLANLKFGELNRSVGPSVSKSVYQLFTFRTMK